MDICMNMNTKIYHMLKINIDGKNQQKCGYMKTEKKL